MTVRWQFEDLFAAETYVFPVNPGRDPLPDVGVHKTIARRSTSAPDGRTVLFEGQDAPEELSWSGVMLTQEHYETFLGWARKRRQIRVTDELNVSHMVYIETFDPKRAPKHSHPYRRTYTIKAPILDWPA